MCDNFEYRWFKGDPSQFEFIEECFFGDRIVLIVPKPEKAVGAEWNEEDKIYRSSVWRVSDGKPISLGYKKFVNFGEQPGFEPVCPNDKAVFVEKIDGTCLICSRYKGQGMFRTRGTTNAFKMHNGHELEWLLFSGNPVEMLQDELGEGYSIIFEWVSPENRLCVFYPEFKLYLTGIVKHDDYSYLPQEEVDRLAKKYGFDRPARSAFHDCVDLPEVAEKIFNEWELREGVVAYIGDDQQILKKMKSEWQLKMHVARSLIGNTNRLIDWCYDNGIFTPGIGFDEVKNIFSSKFEHEVSEYYKEEIQNIWVAWTCVDLRISSAKAVVADKTDPHEILRMIDENVWNSSPAYLWPVFRHKEYKKSFICSEVKNFME